MRRRLEEDLDEREKDEKSAAADEHVKHLEPDEQSGDYEERGDSAAAVHQHVLVAHLRGGHVLAIGCFTRGL